MNWRHRICGGIIIVIFTLGACANDPEKLTVENYGIQNEVILKKVKEGIHEPTGLIADQGLESVLRHCVSCHSSKLIIQNRADAEGWQAMIDWMYKTQNLPQLGDQEPIIVAYLAKNYPPEKTGRRKPLEDVEWYDM